MVVVGMCCVCSPSFLCCKVHWSSSVHCELIRLVLAMGGEVLQAGQLVCGGEKGEQVIHWERKWERNMHGGGIYRVTVKNCEKFLSIPTCHSKFPAPSLTLPSTLRPPTPGCTEMHWCDIIATLLPWGAVSFFYQPSDHRHTSKLAGNVQDSGSFEGPVFGWAVGTLQKVLQTLELTKRCCIMRCCHSTLSKQDDTNGSKQTNKQTNSALKVVQRH